MTLKVTVSPHYHGVDWYDPKSGITFSKGKGEILIPDGVNMYNINRYINLNYLNIVQDEASTPEPDTIIHSTPNQLLSEVETKIETQVNADEVIEETEKVVVDESLTIIEAKEIVAEEATIAGETEITEPEVKEEIVVEEIKNEKVECQFCNKEYSTRGIASHEKACKENPENQ